MREYEGKPYTLRHYALTQTFRAAGSQAVDGDRVKEEFDKLPLFKLAASSESETDCPDDDGISCCDDSDAYDEDNIDEDYGHNENDPGIENRQQSKEFLRRLGVSSKSKILSDSPDTLG